MKQREKYCEALRQTSVVVSAKYQSRTHPSIWFQQANHFWVNCVGSRSKTSLLNIPTSRTVSKNLLEENNFRHDIDTSIVAFYAYVIPLLTQS